MALDHDGQGVDQLEFVVGMLQVLGVELCGEPLHWNDVRPFIILFDRLDVSKTRKLSQIELAEYVNLTELAKLELTPSKAPLRDKSALARTERSMRQASRGPLPHCRSHRRSHHTSLGPTSQCDR